MDVATKIPPPRTRCNMPMLLRRAGAHTVNALAEIVDPGQRFAFPGMRLVRMSRESIQLPGMRKGAETVRKNPVAGAPFRFLASD